MKTYKKPGIEIVLLQQRNMMLTGSYEVHSLNENSDFKYGASDDDYDDDAR